MSYNLNPEELVVAAAVLSIYIAKNRTSDEINLLGNLFQAIGTNLSTIATVTPQNESTTNNKNNTNE
ncbi:hypothetical protein IO99_06955 [Clostridium sulfidigenes]|uniref:Uncharacterized protein n=1 Tax=Clostridium sulfidigenes TaxID=318464 RepID=A0A084JDF0_9CLOT|nr:hypothetical protein [Clostridium sulfidigenes]KEZ86984.1 hypothetical protein IO99_06955 [Clostridium sulfidigenes]